MHTAKICWRNLYRNTCVNFVRRNHENNFYDPPYLEHMKPKIPLLQPMNVQIKGYDFALVESFQKLVHRIAKVMDIEVSDGWAVPAKVEKIQKFKPNSTVIDSEYVLSTYERNVQLLDLPVNIAPVFIEMIQAGLPQGISFEIHQHLPEHETIRYVPDFELKELKSQLETLGGPTKKK
ncbi:hypothetical protein O3M35_008928 [Rhynocoris fuscipes]|uniref:Small ribosomal subunit protein uS10 domain-containing protein n=1 Tax=Rhynocoris fuscipes TaxID=488301 RepID=A0AAW1DFC9_9HEMI